MLDKIREYISTDALRSVSYAIFAMVILSAVKIQMQLNV